MSNKEKRLFAVLGTTMVMLLSGCSLLGENDSSIPPAETVSITLHDENYADTFSVEVGKQASITELTKQGYYSKGYYDSATGGEKYFEADGTSVSVWSKSYPTDLYVQYAPISEFCYEKTYITKGEEFSYYTGQSVSVKGEFLNAIKGNLNKNVKIEVSFSAYDSKEKDWALYFKNVAKYDEGSLTMSKILEKYPGVKLKISSSFNIYSFSKTVSASTINAGKNISLIITRGNTFGEGEIRDCTMKFTFVD